MFLGERLERRTAGFRSYEGGNKIKRRGTLIKEEGDGPVQERKEEGQITPRMFDKDSRNHIVYIYLKLYMVCCVCVGFMPLGMAVLPARAINYLTKPWY